MITRFRNLSWPLILIMLLLKIIGISKVVNGNLNLNINDSNQVDKFEFLLRNAVTTAEAEEEKEETLNYNEARRVKRLIGGSLDSKMFSTTTTTTMMGLRIDSESHKNNNNNVGVGTASSNYYQVDNANVVDNNDDDDDDENDNDNNLSEHEIQELVEHNLIQSDFKNRPKGPPPFVKALQSSSQEDFIVKEVDITDENDDPVNNNNGSIAVNGTHYNASSSNSQSQHHKRLILIPASSSKNNNNNNEVIKRKKSSETNFMNDHHHHNSHLYGTVDDGTRIKCICDTKECTSNDMLEPTVCFTHGMCYTQYLDMDDGTPTITKGCISGETPLLCENRRPASKLLQNKRWPYLACCKSHLCNAGELTTRKTTVPTTITIRAKPESDVNVTITGEQLGSSSVGIAVADSRNDTIRSERHQTDDIENNINQHFTISESKNESQSYNATFMSIDDAGKEINIPNSKAISISSPQARFISPLASSFLIGGAILIVIVSAIGFYILRKEQQRVRRNYYRNTEQEGQINNNENLEIDEEIAVVRLNEEGITGLNHEEAHIQENLQLPSSSTLLNNKNAKQQQNKNSVSCSTNPMFLKHSSNFDPVVESMESHQLLESSSNKPASSSTNSRPSSHSSHSLGTSNVPCTNLNTVLLPIIPNSSNNSNNNEEIYNSHNCTPTTSVV